jgi:hypothetical protein
MSEPPEPLREAFQSAIQSAQAAGYSDWLAPDEAALDYIATRIAPKFSVSDCRKFKCADLSHLGKRRKEFAVGKGPRGPKRGTIIRMRSFLPKRIPDAETFHRQLATRFVLAEKDFKIIVEDTRDPMANPPCLICPKCQTTDHVESAKRFVEQPPSLF